jgi:DNA-binding NarL/FixJ family response regulator
LDVTRILVADDHPMFRAAMVLAAQRVCPGAAIVEAGTLGMALAASQGGPFDLVLLDLKMPGAEGYSGVALLHAEMPATPILVVSSAEAAQSAAAVQRFGAVGFVGKEQDLAAIEAAIAAALAGTRIETPIEADLDAVAIRVAALTPTQLRVLLGVLAGRLNKQIAHDLGVTEATVKAHMTAIMRKLDVQNRTQAVLAARALGLAY